MSLWLFQRYCKNCTFIGFEDHFLSHCSFTMAVACFDVQRTPLWVMISVCFPHEVIMFHSYLTLRSILSSTTLMCHWWIKPSRISLFSIWAGRKVKQRDNSTTYRISERKFKERVWIRNRWLFHSAGQKEPRGVTWRKQSEEHHACLCTSQDLQHV